jgi:hypothetical protein
MKTVQISRLEIHFSIKIKYFIIILSLIYIINQLTIMAKNLNIVLIIAIGLILLFLICNNNSNNKSEIDLSASPVYNYKYYENMPDTDYDRVINDVESVGSDMSSISNSYRKSHNGKLRPIVVERLNPNLIEIQ